jgi:hypothetical protein
MEAQRPISSGTSRKSTADLDHQGNRASLLTTLPGQLSWPLPSTPPPLSGKKNLTKKLPCSSPKISAQPASLTGLDLRASVSKWILDISYLPGNHCERKSSQSWRRTKRPNSQGWNLPNLSQLKYIKLNIAGILVSW